MSPCSGVGQLIDSTDMNPLCWIPKNHQKWVNPENGSGLPRCRDFGILEEIRHHKLQESVRLFTSKKTGGSRKHYVELAAEQINYEEQMGV